MKEILLALGLIQPYDLVGYRSAFDMPHAVVLVSNLTAEDCRAIRDASQNPGWLLACVLK